jgi:hypothetical protein
VLCGRFNWWPSRLARREAQLAVEPGQQKAAAARG